jgi:uncharacterized hydrophobic protein (TIGR00271 family)
MKEQEITPQEPKLNIKEYLKHLFDIKKGTSKAGTIQDIKDGISIKGHTAWILIFSILIASIGLNVSSTAVVIGAMLIAPLMGPILGVGLSVAINDIETLKHSLVNLGAMMAISLVTSFLFFSIPLFQEATPEILARTKPDLRDALIAIAGGLALIVSLSRRKEMISTIAGVAIATALMPPICTAGYGLAVGRFDYFGGAMFLFTINSIFIALATFVILKFLRFPSVKRIDSNKQKFITRLASIVATVVLLGSIYTFYGLVQEKKFTKKAQLFVNELKNEGISIIDRDMDDFDYANNKITITVFGKRVSNSDKKDWKEKLKKLDLPNTKLVIQQGKDDSDMIKEFQNLRETYANQLKYISDRDATIKDKDALIADLKSRLKEFPFVQISQEAKINYSGLKAISYANKIATDFKQIDTIAVFTTQWYDSVPKTDEQFKKLQLWLKTRLQLDTLKVIKE